jgi:hypothetical protein
MRPFSLISMPDPRWWHAAQALILTQYQRRNRTWQILSNILPPCRRY